MKKAEERVPRRLFLRSMLFFFFSEATAFFFFSSRVVTFFHLIFLFSFSVGLFDLRARSRRSQALAPAPPLQQARGLLILTQRLVGKRRQEAER